MILDLPEDDWFKVMLSLASTARGRKPDAKLRKEAGSLGQKIRAGIESTQSLALLAKPGNIPAPTPAVQREVKPAKSERGVIASFFRELIAG